MDTITTTTAWTLAHGPQGPPAFAPWGALMFFLITLLLLGGLLFLLSRRGGPPWTLHRTRPEEEARRTLADRFARGDLTVEEFMERASALNWVPGKKQGPGRT